MPFALASPANSLFQASKPAAELPHCAASACGLEHASMATVRRVAVVSPLRLVIRKSLGWRQPPLETLCDAGRKRRDAGRDILLERLIKRAALAAVEIEDRLLHPAERLNLFQL